MLRSSIDDLPQENVVGSGRYQWYKGGKFSTNSRKIPTIIAEYFSGKYIL